MPELKNLRLHTSPTLRPCAQSPLHARITRQSRYWPQNKNYPKPTKHSNEKLAQIAVTRKPAGRGKQVETDLCGGPSLTQPKTSPIPPGKSPRNNPECRWVIAAASIISRASQSLLHPAVREHPTKIPHGRLPPPIPSSTT